jgi:gluconate kinase
MTQLDRRPNLAGWVPIQVVWEQGRPLVEWCYLGGRRFREPFFEQTIGEFMRLPFNLLFRRRTAIDILAAMQAERPGLAPCGLIFHMSRCGSTLVGQMLAALPQNMVLSEAGPIDEVLRASRRDPGITDSTRIDWLRGIVSALAQPQRSEKQLVIKLDAWHILDWPLLQRAFPGVPALFLYRDPVEVLVSQCRQPASYMIPGMFGPVFAGVDAWAAQQMGAEEYGARVLSQMCTAAVEWHQQTGGLLVSYKELPDAVCSVIAGFFNIACSGEDQERMRRVAQFNAKTPAMYFADDTAEKQSRATPELRRTAEKWIEPAYGRLDELRRLSRP